VKAMKKSAFHIENRLRSEVHSWLSFWCYVGFWSREFWVLICLQYTAFLDTLSLSLEYLNFMPRRRVYKVVQNRFISVHFARFPYLNT
jgi:hypothetical protein